ncbi:MAG TPA: tripartite tricarboxylate transporter substrate binding protein [Pseudolabrys sp.]|nr:tripartite tricarboxylate transporter substrate binding protein [Pseudolabrys sp.]
MRRRDVLTFIASAVAAAPLAAYADTYPSRPITMVVPFPAGGATDVLARVLGERMKDILGQPIVVENVGGAAGTIAVGRVARTAADGYTLSIGTSTTHMLTGGLYDLQYNLLTDFDPIIMIGSEPLLIVTKKDFPANNLKELIAWLKANPGKASVGIAGVGATGHLAGIAFQKDTGTTFQFVPYRGNAPAMQDLAAGQIDFMMEPSSNFRSLVQGHLIKPIAITSPQRTASYPDVPTVEEAGVPGFTASLWYGLWVRHGVPNDIIAKLNDTMRQTLADPAIQKRLGDLGVQITPASQQSPDDLRTFQKAEADRWWPIIKAANIPHQ